DDGKAETLRLLFATPRRWLDDGKHITVERAPTMFGELSINVASHLASGTIVAELELPARQPPAKTLIRFRVPAGWRVRSALVDARRSLAFAGAETFDLTGLTGRCTITVRVDRAR